MGWIEKLSPRGYSRFTPLPFRPARLANGPDLSLGPPANDLLLAEDLHLFHDDVPGFITEAGRPVIMRHLSPKRSGKSQTYSEHKYESDKQYYRNFLHHDN